jgi:hypothetical protein
MFYVHNVFVRWWGGGGGVGGSNRRSPSHIHHSEWILHDNHNFLLWNLHEDAEKLNYYYYY